MANIRFHKKEIDLAFERFLVDARDDFYPDPFRYVDLKLVKAELVQLITQDLNRIINLSQVTYQPKQVYHWDVPKSNYIVRHSVLLHPYDAISYHVLLNKLVKLIEPSLSKARYSYIIKNPSAKYLFGKKGVDNWIKYKSDIRNLFKKSKSYRYLVSTDIAGFYEYTHLLDFKKQLHNLTSNRAERVVEILNSFLRKVSISDHSGIPQNYDPSSYLCSAFLDFLDKELEASGLKHFRYVDDIKIACKSKKDGMKAIIKVIHSLRQKNLNLQTAKTEIWNHKDEKFRNFVKDFPKILADVDAAVKGKKKHLIDSLLPKLVADTKKLIREKENFDERLFRAYIRRIVKCHYFKNIKRTNLDLINKRCIDLIHEMPSRTDTFIQFLVLNKNKKSVQLGLFCAVRESVYHWQETKLWELFIQSDQIKVPEVFRLARGRLRKAEIHSPIINNIILFLGKHGNYQDREYIANLISKPHSHYTKRHILIAIQECAGKNTIYNRVTSSNNDVMLKSLVKYLNQLKTPRYMFENLNIGSDLAFIY